jgi:hypothetical protein
MNEKETGGPAFARPGAVFKGPNGQDMGNEASLGMSLRDYFAAKAMPAVYRDFWDDVRANRHGGTVPEDWAMGLALGAYQMADAMLRAREAS